MSYSKRSIRIAKPSDFLTLAPWDEFWGDRRQEIQRGEIYVGLDQEESCVGYIRLARHEFLNFPLISALCVRSDFRRHRVATGLIRYVEGLLPGQRLFCTTEVTNAGMLALLNQTGYKKVGYIDELNSDGGRELILVRNLV